uniref:Uncharacterized protein n=1 Tax=Chrysemys picta bellii TaxID=8478 RepID=A0A8C3FS73_CHRPI
MATRFWTVRAARIRVSLRFRAGDTLGRGVEFNGLEQRGPRHQDWVLFLAWDKSLHFSAHILGPAACRSVFVNFRTIRVPDSDSLGPDFPPCLRPAWPPSS